MGIYSELSALEQQPKHAQVNATRKHKSPTRRPRKKTEPVPNPSPKNYANAICRAVRRAGKEAGTYRLSAKEKAALVKIVYSFRIRGIRTSENQVARIAINHTIEDLEQKGTESVLSRTLEALND